MNTVFSLSTEDWCLKYQRQEIRPELVKLHHREATFILLESKGQKSFCARFSF